MSGEHAEAVVDPPFRGTEAIRAGAVTWGQLRGPTYQRLFPDVYAPAALEPDLAARSRGAYLLVRDRGGVRAGYSAALLLGTDCAPPDAPAEVIVPGGRRTHPGIRAQRATVPPHDVTTVGGCRLTNPARTAWDLARRLLTVDAVVAVDALARVGLFEPAALLARRDRGPGARGCRHLDTVVALADRRAESPMETRLRVALTRVGLPPEPQYPVYDEYGFVLARVDLAYPAAKLAIEYDGSTHFDRRRVELDHERDTALAGYGWQTQRVNRTGMGPALLQTVTQVHRLLVLRAPASYAHVEIDRAALRT
jgi:very-short-patch-repair endonuclease